MFEFYIQLTPMAIITMTFFLRTNMHRDSVTEGGGRHLEGSTFLIYRHDHVQRVLRACDDHH